MIDTVLIILRFFGIFRLVRRIRGPQLTILCYHGFSLLDEHIYSPSLFMTRDTFAKRMRRLRELGYNLVPLDAAVRMLQDGTLTKDMLVITIDDGWLGGKDKAAPILSEYNIPATFYITTYYVQKELPVFNMLIKYLVDKTEKRNVNMGHVCTDLVDDLDLSSPKGRNAATRLLVDFSETLDVESRQEFADLLAHSLDIDRDEISRIRIMHLMKKDELSELAQMGFDIQLHTHRHRGFKTLNDPDLLRSEIEMNKSFLSDISSRPLVHYCYPSGAFHDRQVPWLEQLDIVSATTCEHGSNKIGSNPLQLKRILDGEHLSQVRFEAELCGFGVWIRQCKSLLKREIRS